MVTSKLQQSRLLHKERTFARAGIEPADALTGFETGASTSSATRHGLVSRASISVSFPTSMRAREQTQYLIIRLFNSLSQANRVWPVSMYTHKDTDYDLCINWLWICLLTVCLAPTLPEKPLGCQRRLALPQDYETRHRLLIEQHAGAIILQLNTPAD